MVTFALKPEELLKIKMAEQIGSLSLALRKPNDTKLGNTDTEFTGDQLLAARKRIRRRLRPKGAATAKVIPVAPIIPKEEPKAVEEPKLVQKEMLILNGTVQTRVQWQETPDGTIVNDNESSTSRPPRNQAKPKQQGDL